MNIADIIIIIAIAIWITGLLIVLTQITMYNKTTKGTKNAGFSTVKQNLIDPNAQPEVIEYVFVQFKDNTSKETAVSIRYNAGSNIHKEIRKALNFRYNKDWKTYKRLT